MEGWVEVDISRFFGCIRDISNAACEMQHAENSRDDGGWIEHQSIAVNFSQVLGAYWILCLGTCRSAQL